MGTLSWEWWLGLAAWTLVVFRIGIGVGRLARARDRIQPIDPARISADVQARIRDLLRDHRKIEAIKLLREETGCGLAEAKKTIDAIPQSI